MSIWRAGEGCTGERRQVAGAPRGAKVVILLLAGLFFANFVVCCELPRVNWTVEVNMKIASENLQPKECSAHHATRQVARYGSQRHNVAEACKSQRIKVQTRSPFGQQWVSGSAVRLLSKHMVQIARAKRKVSQALCMPQHSALFQI